MRCMDRAVLSQMLDQGLSLAEIGRRVERHEATVGYWVKKYGLHAVNSSTHAARGALAREELENLVKAGVSIAQIAEAVGRSKTTVRYWLKEYGLRTRQPSRRETVSGQPKQIMRDCPRHGLGEFQLRSSGGYRCLKCRSEAVTRRRRRVKQLLVDEAGGVCRTCGYGRCVAALHFHHREPADKRFALSLRGVTRSLVSARAEAEKCVLLCANCHAEVEAGVRQLP
jgi:transposase